MCLCHFGEAFFYLINLYVLNLEVFNSNWDVTKKQKAIFLISYSPVRSPALNMNDMLNKKKYAQNDATAPQINYKC